MLQQTRFAIRRVPCRRSPFQATQGFSGLSESRHNSSLAPEPPSSDDSSAAVEAESPPDISFEAEDVGEDAARPESYNEFMKAIGENFRHASPRNWLGGEVPFPMNPSFMPPAPLSDAVRTQIYTEYMQDPIKNSVRTLSQKYHISLKRIDAMLRLKGLENAWVKQESKQLQTGFQEGMEKLLGVKEDQRIRNLALNQGQDDWTRYDVHEADTLEQEENRDAARQRYQRLYWESVSESGGEPVVPASLEHAKQRARRLANKALGSDRSSAPHIQEAKYIGKPREKVQITTKPGRTMIEFRDVGSKFLDSTERSHRVVTPRHRARARGEKRTEEAGV